MKNLVILLLLLVHQSISQKITERELKTKIEEVTVYVQGGLITRSGYIEIPEGKSTLIVKSLSPHIDDKSIQVNFQ